MPYSMLVFSIESEEHSLLMTLIRSKLETLLPEVLIYVNSFVKM